MSLESPELVVAGTGHIWVAPVGTAFPSKIDTAVNDTLWTDLGYTTEDGVHPLFDTQSKDIFAWQVRDAIRTIITSRPKKIDFTLMQWNQNTWALAHGGGSWATTTSGNYEYTPPDDGFVDERAGIIEFEDDDKHYRLCITKWLNKAPLDTILRSDDTANFPISMSILAAEAGSRSWFGQTDDDNLGLAASAGS